MKQLAHLSFSSINTYRQCPRAWYLNYILGEKQPPSEAASRGQQFDQQVAHSLGLGKPVSEPLIERVQEAVEFYAANGGWTRADQAQREIRITPNQWEVYSALYDVDYQIHLPIIGFIDLWRRDDSGLRVELCDLKTSERNDFRPDWALQCTLYSLVERAYRWSVHLLTFTKALKLHRYSYRPTDETYRWAMNLIGETASRIASTSTERIIDKIPATSGYQCKWCPRQTSCEAALVGGLVPEP